MELILSDPGSASALPTQSHAVGAIENLTLLGGGASNGTGNDLDNVIIGNIGFPNVLIGGGGNDHLDGVWGVDTLLGGAGNDTYVVENPKSVLSARPEETGPIRSCHGSASALPIRSTPLEPSKI